ncbi:efflux RND transporter periplasmic adaptor subunit [uncultured Alistipes sp.]|uniref:efflux RND transporter periplasmic adaptor subunit n=1 Tax=uncultured Alistipes sp. TaxID=538949 RepID=UPI0025A5FA45|nr:efflux RND transporter periplasmic adaptor subunit [uncultured Alistipes sp.]MCX4282534.1 efflux RND transporter periplasmic adaptor subunit [Alistipes sp.]
MKQKFVKAAVAACCAAAVGCVEAPVAAGPEHYAVQTVATSDREIPVYYSATVRGRQDIDIYPQISGTVSELCITEGQQVDEGQTLFIIDQVPYKAALQTAEANVAAAKAGVSTAKLVRDSKKQLFRRKVVSQFDLSSAQNQLLTAEAQLAQAEAQRVSAANNLSYTIVKAPSKGVVGTLPFRVGALVGPSAKLTTVSDNSEMYIYFSMTENQLLNLTRRYGSTAATLQNMPDVQLQLSDGSLYDHSGRVESISGVIDASTGSVQLRAAFPNKNGLLHSGGSGNIILPSVYKDCIVIPQTATFEIQDKVYVYKVIDGKASSAMIDVEKVTNGREYIVRSGLEPGETIVAEGVGLLREGTPIVPKQPQAEAEAEAEAEAVAETVPDAQTAKEE